MAAIPGPGWFCHPCAKEAGNNPFKKPQTGRKFAFRFVKISIMGRIVTEFPVDQIITKYINDVESLGDIGTLNVEAITKARSKKRSL
jgi:DNA repair protein RAD7